MQNFFMENEVESGKCLRNSELGSQTASSGLDSNTAQGCSNCGCLPKVKAASILAWSSWSSIVHEFSPVTEELWTADGFRRGWERVSFL